MLAARKTRRVRTDLFRPDPTCRPIYLLIYVLVRVVCGCQSDGDDFPSTTRTLQKSGNLTIARLTAADHGRYECVASNVIADVITATFIIIEGIHYQGRRQV